MTLQISPEIVAFFKKICDGEPILTVVSNIGEDVQYRCFNYLHGVKIVSQPDTTGKALLGITYSLQIIESEFAEPIYASHRMGTAPICLKIFALAVLNELDMVGSQVRIWGLPFRAAVSGWRV